MLFNAGQLDPSREQDERDDHHRQAHLRGASPEEERAMGTAGSTAHPGTERTKQRWWWGGSQSRPVSRG